MIRSCIAALLLLMPATALAGDFTQTVSAQPGGRLELDLRGGHVVIETHEQEAVRVDAYAPSGFLGRSMKFEIKSDGTNVELKGEGGGWFSGGAKVRVRVPRVYSVEIETAGGNVEIGALEGSVEAQTSGGNITLDGARGDVEVRTSGGRIVISDVVGDVEARTSGGPIRVSEVEGEIDVETSGGAIHIYDVTGPVRARTSGGRIEVRFAGDPEGDLRTSGGPIVAEIPRGAGIDLKARTSGGRVKLESGVAIELRGGIDPQNVEGRVNGGGPDLKLQTSGGNVSIRVR